MPHDPNTPHDYEPSDAHDHEHAPTTGPVADASVRTAWPHDAAAVGRVQAAVWRSAYAEVLPEEVLDQFEPSNFARAWRTSLKAPPGARHALLVVCAGDQVLGFAALGPSLDPDANESSGEVLAMGVHPGSQGRGHGSRLLNAAADTLRGKGFTSMSIWLLARDEATRAFLSAAGLSPDSAFRDRVVDVDGAIAREVRLTADLSEQ